MRGMIGHEANTLNQQTDIPVSVITQSNATTEHAHVKGSGINGRHVPIDGEPNDTIDIVERDIDGVEGVNDMIESGHLVCPFV